MKSDALIIVEELNDIICSNQNEEQIYDGGTGYLFEYASNGYAEEISYGKVCLWNSEDDERERDYTDGECVYENLKIFLIRKLNEYANEAKQIADWIEK